MKDTIKINEFFKRLHQNNSLYKFSIEDFDYKKLISYYTNNFKKLHMLNLKNLKILIFKRYV